MVDVSLRHKPSPGVPREAGPLLDKTSAARARAWRLFAGLVGLAVIAGALYLHGLGQGTVGGVTDPTPVALTVAGHDLLVPANMLRDGALRHGGTVARVDIALHWPDFRGYTEATADDFIRGDPRAPIIYASISGQVSPLDATARLDTVYARFFTGEPVAGPAGLVGRTLNPDSGFGGEIVYFLPSAQQPFVARCPARETPEVPATCLRDINLGSDLTILFRFDRNLLGHWQQLEAGMRQLTANLLVR